LSLATTAGLELLLGSLVLVEQRHDDFSVEGQGARAAAEEALHEHGARERRESILFKGVDARPRDLGVDRQLLDAHPAALSLLTDILARRRRALVRIGSIALRRADDPKSSRGNSHARTF